MKYKKTKPGYSHFENEVELVSGIWTAIYVAVTVDNKIVLRACGEDYTDDYYPNYCPECGRKLNEGI
jgi:hypothetical protein